MKSTQIWDKCLHHESGSYILNRYSSISHTTHPKVTFERKRRSCVVIKRKTDPAQSRYVHNKNTTIEYVSTHIHTHTAIVARVHSNVLLFYIFFFVDFYVNLIFLLFCVYYSCRWWQHEFSVFNYYYYFARSHCDVDCSFNTHSHLLLNNETGVSRLIYIYIQILRREGEMHCEL